jgi:glucokinase
VRFADAVAFFLKDHREQAPITEAVVAVAGPVEADRCALTNCSWVIDARELHETFGMKARIVNDFEAFAWRIWSELEMGRPNQEPRWRC